MQYRVMAYKCKVNSLVELGDNMTAVGSFYEGGELFLICLEPLEPMHLPGEEQPEGSDKGDGD